MGASHRPLSRKWVELAAVFLCVLVADQGTKYLAVEHLTFAFQSAAAHTLGARLHAFLFQRHLLPLARAGGIAVLPDFFHLRYAENPGAAWGLLAEAPERFRALFFELVSAGAVAFILLHYRKLRDDQRLLRIAFALVLGGAVGNLVDRLARGYVIDFIDWHWYDPRFLAPMRHWPTFNVADSGITLGVALLFLEALLTKKPAAEPKAAARKA